MTMRITKNILLAPIAILFLSSCANFPSEVSKRLEIKSDAVNFITCEFGDLDHEIVINTTDETSEILFESGLYLKGSYRFDQPMLTYFINYFYEDEEVLKYQIPVFSNIFTRFQFSEIKNIPDIKEKDFENIRLDRDGIVNTQFLAKCVLTDVIPR